LRRDWTPDQIQNQLYEAYVRKSTGQGGEKLGDGSPEPDSELGVIGADSMPEDSELIAQARADAPDKAKQTGSDRPATLVPAQYSRIKDKPASDTVPAWLQKHRRSIWRSPIYFSSSDQDAYYAVRRMGNPDGWTIIYTHGDVRHDGKVYDTSRGEPHIEMNAAAIYNDLQHHHDYDPKANILLTACYGANDKTARELSALTHGVVYAAKGYVSEPSVGKNVYRLTVNNQYGKTTGYAKFVNGVEVPSSLLSLNYDKKANIWKSVNLKKPAPVGDRSPSPGKEPLWWRILHLS